MKKWLDKYDDGGSNLEDMKASFLQQYRPSPQADNTRLGAQRANVTNAQAQQLQKDVVINAQRAAEERARLANARQTVDNKSIAFTFPNGESKTWNKMTQDEKDYVNGQSLRTKGRVFESGKEGFIDTYLNPLNWVGNMAAGAAESNYMAKETGSNMPYITGYGLPLVMGRMMGSGTMNPLSKKFYTNSISDADFVNNIGLGIPKAGVNLASKLPLENIPIINQAYKVNPWAFTGQEGMMYRGLGKEGMKDALESGVFRAKQDVQPVMDEIHGKFNMSKQFNKAYYSPKFKTADTYGQGYIAEVPRDASTWAQRYKRNDWSQIAARDIPVNEGRILEKNWLQGYSPIETSTDNLINFSKIPEYYNKVATGESALPIAWKSPAIGLSQESSQAMFDKLLNSGQFTDEESRLIRQYQNNSKPFTGRDIPSEFVNYESRKRLNSIIKKYNLEGINNAIATRRFNPDNNSIGAIIKNNTFNFGDRPTSFSAGIGLSEYGSGATNRIVIPNRYLSEMGDKFIVSPYAGDFLRMADEKELIGTGLNFKRIGKVKNDIGGYDHIVKPFAEGGDTDRVNIINTPGAILNKKGDQNAFNRMASFLEFQNRMNEAKPVSLNPRVSKQNDIIRNLPGNNKNYAIVDKKADSIFYFNPQGQNITGEPVITGASRNDVDKGLSMADWMKQTGDENHEHYFEYLKQNGLQTTPSGIFHLNALRTDVAQDPNRVWRFINNAIRPDAAKKIHENRIKDYGPRELMYTFSDENNKPSSKAIHGTARQQRLDAFNSVNSDRALSNGCINVNGRSICFNALVPGSNLYILPEKSDNYLYPQQKMDVNNFSPLNEYYKDGGSINNWKEVEVPHTKNQLSGWLDKL